MNKNKFRLTLYLLVAMFSCNKIGPGPGSATLNIINAVNGGNPLVTSFAGVSAKGQPLSLLNYFANASEIAYCSSWESGSYLGLTNLSLSQISDTLTTIWNGTLDLPIGSIHTLFLCGDTTNTDTLYITDHIPYYPISDSVAGVRFVNLISGSTPISINLQGNLPFNYEFSNLGYKQITTFNTYNANSTSTGSYTFEIRTQATDSLMSTFTWNYTLMRNQTIVLAGSVALQTNYPIIPFVVNNF